MKRGHRNEGIVGIERTRQAKRLLTAAIAGCAITAGPAWAASGTWNGAVNAGPHSWNVDANWTGVGFPNGQTQTASLEMDWTAGAAINLNQAITLGGLAIDDTGVSGDVAVTIAAGGGTLTFDNNGSTATLTSAGATNVISAPITLIDNLAVTATNALTLSGSISGAGGITKSGAGTLSLNGAFNAVFGDISVTFGTLSFGTTSTPSSSLLSISSGATATYATSTTVRTFGGLTGAGTLSGTGTNEKRFGISNSADNSFTGSITYSGGSGSGGNQLVKSNVGEFALGGAGTFNGGSATTTIVVNGGKFTLNNAGTNNGNRINDTALLNLGGGEFKMVGNAAAALTETVGAVTIANSAVGVLTVSPASGQSGLFTGASLARAGVATTSAGGAVLFRGPSLGATAGADVAQVKFTAAPTLTGGGGSAGSPSISILPYALGDTSATGKGAGLVTYDSTNGIRLLNTSTEFADYSTAGATDNAKLTPAGALAGQTVNSLLVQNTSGGALTATIDTANLVPTSGAIVFANNATSPVSLLKGTNGLALTATTAYVSVLDPDATATMSGIAFTTSGGLTKAGPGTLVLASANTGSNVQINVAAGTLKAGATNAFRAPNSSFLGTALVVREGATLDLGGFGQSTNGNATSSFALGSVLTNTGANATFIPTGNYQGTSTIAGTITDGTPGDGALTGLVSLGVSNQPAGFTLSHGGHTINNISDSSNGLPTVVTVSTLSSTDNNTVYGTVTVSNAVMNADAVASAASVVSKPLGSAPIALASGGSLKITSRGDAGLMLDGNTLTWTNNVSASSSATFTIDRADGYSRNITHQFGNLGVSGASTTLTVTANNGYVMDYTGATTLSHSAAATETLNVTAGKLKLADIGQSGTGNKSLSKTGAGVLEISSGATVSYLGTTSVTGGTLLMNGTSSGQDNWTVNATATLGGSGTVGLATGKSLTVGGATAGTLAPGNSIGTLSVAGNVVFGDLSTYAVEVGSGTSADRLAITGDLNLASAPTP